MRIESPSKILLASGNPHKHEELSRRLTHMPTKLVRPSDIGSDPPHPEESALTFSGNARIKAIAYSEWAGCPALADDSGLEVDALDGRPGVLSARFAGPDADDRANLEKLLAELSAVPPGQRTGRFVCSLALALGDQILTECRGEVEGHLAAEPRGENGFGYDPVFVPLGYKQTFAEMAPAEKDALSHRGRALDQLIGWLELRTAEPR